MSSKISLDYFVIHYLFRDEIVRYRYDSHNNKWSCQVFDLGWGPAHSLTPPYDCSAEEVVAALLNYIGQGGAQIYAGRQSESGYKDPTKLTDLLRKKDAEIK